MRTALVTGARGFIGSHLVDALLADGWVVRAFVRSPETPVRWLDRVRVFTGDIADARAIGVAAEGADTVFHLAAHVHAVDELDGRERHAETNVEGTRNLLGAAATAERVIFFSSVKAMGEGGPGEIDESAVPRPQTAYGRSKLAAEQLVEDWAAADPGRSGVSLRLPLVYGAGNKGNLFKMIAAVERGVFPPLPELATRRSLVHVRNVVEAAMLAAAGRCSGRFVVTDGRAYSTRELHELIAAHLGRRVPRWHVPLAVLRLAAAMGDVIGRVRGRRFPLDSDALDKLLGNAQYSSARAVRELGYAPQTDFERALPELIAWYRTLRS